MNMWCRTLLLFSLFGILTQLGCGSSPRRTADFPREPGELRITQSVGGAHYRTIIHNDHWFQTFDTDLLVLHPRSGRTLHRLELGRVGEAAPAVDMAVVHDRLFVVLEDQAVIEIAIDDPAFPRMTQRAESEELRLHPRRLSVVENELYISGVGGVTRWRDRALIYPHEEDTGRIATSAEGLVVCLGRRIYRVDDDRYVGSASDLMHAELSDVEPGTLVFTRQLETAAQIGLMTPNLREVDVDAATVAMPGIVRRVHADGDSIWIVTDDEVRRYMHFQNRLVRMDSIDILGSRDIGIIDDDHLAIAGTFGRTIYRRHTTEQGPGDTFLYTQREPSKLLLAKSDGRHILAGSEQGVWLYRIGSNVQLVEETLDARDDGTTPSREATTVDAEARLSDDGRSVSFFTESGSITYQEPGGDTLHCVIAADGRFWIGHDRGITVVEPVAARARRSSPETLQVRIHGQLRLDGPVRYLYPLRMDDGVAFVAERGGFGTARFD